MSDEGSREGSYASPSKPRRNVQVPARFRDSIDDPSPESSPKKRGRGRPVSPGKGSSVGASASPHPIDEPPPPPTPQRGRPPTKKAPVQQASTQPYPPANQLVRAPTLTSANVRRHMSYATSNAKRIAQNELTDSLKENLRKLKNLLKLPQARRWVYCEFFYSCVDEELLLSDNEFAAMLAQAFPNLKTRRLTRTEWRTVRRLIGKPRRCSAAFLEEERMALEQKRMRIRNIYDGINLATVDPTTDFCDLPQRLPRPLVVGMKVFARVRFPKDGVYAGTIDAVIPESYRVTFDKEDLIAPLIIRDNEVMPESRLDLVPLSYFIEQSKATLPNSIIKFTQSPFNPSKLMAQNRGDPRMMGSQQRRPGTDGFSARDEKVGNFPVRMLVILVKLAKLIEHKKGLVRQLSDLNTEAEKINMVSDSYTPAFQEKYARVCVDLEMLNKQMTSFLTGIQEYYTQLMPQLTEVPVTSRPEALRKLCVTHARQIVKHCNNGLNVKDKKALGLITSLTSLLLQVRSLGQQRCSALDMNTLSESLNEIRTKIDPNNIAAFQDYVEVHMKQIHNMMMNTGAV